MIIAVLTIAASVTAVLGFLYVLFIGQKTLIEWWRERRSPKLLTSSQDTHVQEGGDVKILHNVPQPDYGHFINRESELAEIMSKLRPYPHSQHAIVVIDGVGGVGKSALALEVAHRFLNNYPSMPKEERFAAIIWSSAKRTILTTGGITQRKQAIQTLDDIYWTIAVVLKRQEILRSEPAEQHELMRNAISQQRTLLIIDNLETIDDPEVLTFLHELPAPSRAIVTTRHQIDAAYPVRLVGMTWDNAQALITQECEKRGLTLAEADVRRLFESTGGMPLAIVWSVAQIAHGYDVQTVLHRLSQPTDDVARFCFENSLQLIRESPAHQLLMALSLFATDATREALGYVTNLDQDTLARDTGLSTLQKLSLINRHGGRFDMLPLTRTYVQSELVAHKEFALQARTRLLQYFTDLVHARVGKSYWDAITHWLDPETLDLEVENLLQAVTWAVEAKQYDVVLYVGGALVHYLWRVGRSEERRRLAEQGILAAQQVGDMQWEVWLLVDGLGYIYLSRQDLDKAESFIGQGRRVAEQHGFGEGEALALAYLANIAIIRGELDQARDQLKATVGKAQSPAVLARIKAVEGLLAVTTADWPAAEKAYQEAIYYRQQSDGYLPPTQSALLGLLQARQGKYREARITLGEAQRLRQTLEGTGYVKFGQAMLKLADGDLESAASLAEEALTCMRQLRIQRQITDIQRFIYEIQDRHLDQFTEKSRAAWHLIS